MARQRIHIERLHIRLPGDGSTPAEARAVAESCGRDLLQALGNMPPRGAGRIDIDEVTTRATRANAGQRIAAAVRARCERARS